MSKLSSLFGRKETEPEKAEGFADKMSEVLGEDVSLRTKQAEDAARSATEAAKHAVESIEETVEKKVEEVKEFVETHKTGKPEK